MVSLGILYSLILLHHMPTFYEVNRKRHLSLYPNYKIYLHIQYEWKSSNTYNWFDIHSHSRNLGTIKLASSRRHIGKHFITGKIHLLSENINRNSKQSRWIKINRRTDKGCIFYALLLLKSHCLLFSERGTVENHRFPFCDYWSGRSENSTTNRWDWQLLDATPIYILSSPTQCACCKPVRFFLQWFELWLRTMDVWGIDYFVNKHFIRKSTLSGSLYY